MLLCHSSVCPLAQGTFLSKEMYPHGTGLDLMKTALLALETSESSTGPPTFF